jgi:hypothetical protein
LTCAFSEMVRPDMWRAAVGAEVVELASFNDEAGSEEVDGAEEEEAKSTRPTRIVRFKRTL